MMSANTSLRAFVLILALYALCFCPKPASAQGTFQTHITFDASPQLPGPGQSFFVQQYFEAGMWFRPLGTVGPGNGFSRSGGGRAGFPDNGTAFLAAALGDSLVFSFTNGAIFDMISVGLAEFSVTVTSTTVRFVGYRFDGSVVTSELTMDGLIDGPGGFADFQTFNFSPEFSGLSRVEISTIGWSLDNLVVAIPEPSAVALFVAGGVFLWVAKLVRRQ